MPRGFRTLFSELFGADPNTSTSSSNAELASTSEAIQEGIREAIPYTIPDDAVEPSLIQDTGAGDLLTTFVDLQEQDSGSDSSSSVRTSEEEVRAGARSFSNEEKFALEAPKKKPTQLRALDAEKVIAHYLTKHPQARPGDKERRLIASRLKEKHTVEELIEAIDGNHATEYNREKGYNSLELIMRNASKVQQYREAWRIHNSKPGNKPRKSQAELEAMHAAELEKEERERQERFRRIEKEREQEAIDRKKREEDQIRFAAIAEKNKEAEDLKAFQKRFGVRSTPDPVLSLVPSVKSPRTPEEIAKEEADFEAWSAQAADEAAF
jgi:hypothetical protein